MRRHFLSADAQARYTQARFDAIDNIVEVANRERCDFIVVAGDIFESNQVSPDTVIRSCEAMSRNRTPIYLLPGNHDPFDAASIYKSRAFVNHKPDHVTVLKSGEPANPVDTVELVGAPWYSKRPLADLVSTTCLALDPLRRGLQRICVAHGMVHSLSPKPSDPALIDGDVAKQLIDDRIISFLALGDRHSTTEVAPRIWYAGTPEPTDFDESDPGNVIVVQLDESRCDVTKIKVAEWHFVVLDLDIASSGGVDLIRDRLELLPDKPRTIVKLSIRGVMSISDRANLDELLEWARSLFGAIQWWERRSDLIVLPSDADIATLELTGFAKQTVDKLLIEARTQDGSGTDARDALVLLYRLVRGATTSAKS